MKKLLITTSIALALSACGGGSDDTVSQTPATGEEPIVGAALPEPVNTDSLVVENDFSFNTARSINIEFDIEEARGKDASVSICTEYTAVNAYDVDYSSCPVKASMIDGEFSHSMEVTNAYDSVVAVVWFNDASMDPIAQEFSVDQGATARSKYAGQVQTIVWK